MGSFSWLKADSLTNIANIVEGITYKFLIPKEFGGGFIKEKYQDYGIVGTKEDGTEKYDMYELLAFWNKDHIIPYSEHNKRVMSELKYSGEFPLMKEIDEYTDENRGIGIDIGCYDHQIDNLKYPLKLVSASFKGCYEDIEYPSYGDPEQGAGILTRMEYEKHYGKHKHANSNI